MSGDGDATNDVAMVTIPTTQAKYRGTWKGMTDQDLPFEITVDERDMIVNVRVVIRVTFPVSPSVSCIYGFWTPNGIPIENDLFTAEISPDSPFLKVHTNPILTGRFTSTTSVTGKVGTFAVTRADCSGREYVFLVGGGQGEKTWTAQRALLCPTASSLTPTSALTGQSVKITGTNLNSVTGVKFSGNVAAQFSVNSGGTELTAIVPAGAASGPLTLSASDCADVQTAAFAVTGNCTYTLSAAAQNFNASGGTGEVNLTTDASCNWTARSNADWITISSSTSGTGNATVRYTVAANTTGARTGSLTIANQTLTITQAGACPALTLAPVTLPGGTVGTAYNQTLTASGGAAPYGFTLSAGNLPTGLTLSSAGVLSGTPTQSGSFPLTVRATDANGCTGTQTYALVINCPTIVLSPTTLPDGTVGTAYNQTITASPAGGSYTFAVTAGALPAGSTLNTTTGAITGTPTTAATANFTVTATGLGACTGSQAYALTIALPPNPVPTLASLAPAAVVAGSGGLTLTLNGSGFVAASVVQVNGNNRAMTLVNSTTLTIALTAADVATAGTLTVAVINPAPGGGTSGTQSFTINPACTFALTPTTQAFGAAGGSGTVAITTGSGCVWVVVPDADWITILTSKSGVGNDTLRYEVAPLTTGTRTGRITIGGQALTITQTVPPTNPVASVNAASYTPNAPLAPASIVSAFGADLANSDKGESAPSLPLPTTLNGTTVQVKDSAGVEWLAGLFFVGKTQVNYLLPSGTAVGTATVTVTTGAGTVSVGTVQIALVAAGIFAANADGKGPVVGNAVRVKNGVVIGNEPLASYDPVLQKMVSVPLDVSKEDERVVIQIYGTGICNRSSLTNVTATIGGVNVVVEYAGEAPGYVGLDQVNLEVPRSLSERGEIALVLMVEGKGANTVRISIK